MFLVFPRWYFFVMKAGKLCNRRVVTIAGAESLLEAAKKMREGHVGSLLVVREEKGKRIPVGILTDRDILMVVLSEGVTPQKINVVDIMSENPVTVPEDMDVSDVITLMRRHGVRRMPVVDSRRDLVGILAIDDLLECFSRQLGELSKIFSLQREQEAVRRP